MARMFEDAKIERLLMGLDAPRYGMVRSYIDPADQIRLDRLAYQRIKDADMGVKGIRKIGRTLLCISSSSIPAIFVKYKRWMRKC